MAACDRAASTSERPAAGASVSGAATAPPPSAWVSLAAPVASGMPLAPEKIEAVVNPKRDKAYTGPVGTVRGTVVASGDAPVPTPLEIPANCLLAHEMYDQAFRQGMMRSLADVFVAVTGYQGYLPAKQDRVLVEAKGCAFDRRTVGMTFGQILDVQSKDALGYVPELLGAREAPQLVATPGGKAVQVFPEKPGRYQLVDSMRLFARAEVLVVKYSTFDVTGLDGRFEITGVPVGKVKLSALLPLTMGVAQEQEVEVVADQAVEVSLEIPFSAASYQKLRAQAEAVDEQRDRLRQGNAVAPR